MTNTISSFFLTRKHKPTSTLSKSGFAQGLKSAWKRVLGLKRPWTKVGLEKVLEKCLFHVKKALKMFIYAQITFIMALIILLKSFLREILWKFIINSFAQKSWKRNISFVHYLVRNVVYTSQIMCTTSEVLRCDQFSRVKTQRWGSVVSNQGG